MKRNIPPCPRDPDKEVAKTLSHLKGLAQNRQVKFRETPGKKLDLSKCKVKLGE